MTLELLGYERHASYPNRSMGVIWVGNIPKSLPESDLGRYIIFPLPKSLRWERFGHLQRLSEHSSPELFATTYD